MEFHKYLPFDVIGFFIYFFPRSRLMKITFPIFLILSAVALPTAIFGRSGKGTKKEYPRVTAELIARVHSWGHSAILITCCLFPFAISLCTMSKIHRKFIEPVGEISKNIVYESERCRVKGEDSFGRQI